MHTQCIYRNQRCKFSSNRENILFHTNAVSLLKYKRQFVMKQEASQPGEGLHPDSRALPRLERAPPRHQCTRCEQTYGGCHTSNSRILATRAVM